MSQNSDRGGWDLQRQGSMTCVTNRADLFD